MAVQCYILACALHSNLSQLDQLLHQPLDPTQPSNAEEEYGRATSAVQPCFPPFNIYPSRYCLVLMSQAPHQTQPSSQAIHFHGISPQRQTTYRC
ncbi:hypothetical protein N656DRAFT_4943 [Canariomyces notabilis]|uniref:Uncharacterized protein n=1 Tax=Canariomyces notabilis TaxID=2074819 RepID=A0AAN6TM79_9PEZI|nr:hypothetical protein N656DRAFT_4943 [Canariomyces arenarius]